MVWNFQDSYNNLPSIYYSKVKPETFSNKKLILFNSDLAKKINLNFDNYDENEICDILLGSKLNKDFLSQAYAGHQFGHFTILGDGRALLLGEHITKNNERYDIQLKGSGETPYSRNGDGKAILGPMIREYIVSEAMYNLGIPSTRALAVISTGEKIMREKIEKGAILIRIAKSHIRVGTFQFGSLLKNRNELNKLIFYTINRLYPELNNYKNKYIESVELKLSNDYNTLEYNDFNPYYLLLSQLPEGVKLTTFSLNPNEIQPSGSVNMSCIDGKNIEVLVNDEYLSEYYNNKNNPNNSGSIFKIIYTKYNQLIVDKGKGAFKYY